MTLTTERLLITELTMDMAEAVHRNSLDEDNRRFVPDEVFETLEDAQEIVEFLISQYGETEGPLVYAVLLRGTGENIGYVQLVPLDEENWELGYHIAKPYTCRGYAAEAVKAFLPDMTRAIGIDTVLGICLQENAASVRVMEKCGFTLLEAGVGTYQGEQRDIIRMCWKSAD